MIRNAGSETRNFLENQLFFLCLGLDLGTLAIKDSLNHADHLGVAALNLLNLLIDRIIGALGLALVENAIILELGLNLLSLGLKRHKVVIKFACKASFEVLR